MKDWKDFITIGCLLMFTAGIYQNGHAQENLAQQTYAIFQQNCLNCHGEHGAFTEEIIINHTALIETRAVVPRKPIESELYTRLLEADPTKRMPLGQPQLSPTAILTIGNWIQAGAPDWETPYKQMAPLLLPRKCSKRLRNMSIRCHHLIAPSHAILHSHISITLARRRRHSTLINAHSQN